MSAELRIEAPTDAKAEASEIIAALKASTYCADDYAAPSASPTHDDADFAGYYDDEVPF